MYWYVTRVLENERWWHVGELFVGIQQHSHKSRPILFLVWYVYTLYEGGHAEIPLCMKAFTHVFERRSEPRQSFP